MSDADPSEDPSAAELVVFNGDRRIAAGPRAEAAIAAYRAGQDDAAPTILAFDGAGRIVDLVFEGATNLRAVGAFEKQKFIQKPSALAKDFLGAAQRPLAFVGIGFGAAPTSASDRLLWKGEFNEAEHPRVGPGTPEGGEFRSADGASDAEVADNPTDGLINQNVVARDLMSTVEKRAARRVLRNRIVAGLRLLAGTAADAVPIAGEIFDAVEIAQTIKDGVALEKDVNAAMAYAKEGPQALESLQMSPDYQSFSSVNAFKKIIIGKVFGPAGEGSEYHHIVWQGGANADNIPAELLHSTENMVRVPRLLHEAITAEYSLLYEGTGKTLREWLDTQPYEVQRAEGIKVMRKLGIIQ